MLHAYYRTHVNRPKLQVCPLPNHATSSVGFDFDEAAVYRISVLFLALGTRRRVLNRFYPSVHGRRLGCEDREEMTPKNICYRKKSLKINIFVQQFVRFSFLAKSFYQNYHRLTY
jgi:hypothetical protein